MKIFAKQRLSCCAISLAVFSLVVLTLAVPALRAQASSAHPAAHPRAERQHLRSRLYIYDLRTGKSHLVYTADAIWEAPNWSPDGKYLISNSKGTIYKFVLEPNGTAQPRRLAIPAKYRCNNDKEISPDGKKLGFSANVLPDHGSQVFLADADGDNVKLMVSPSPSYFHGWSPDGKTMAFVAQRNGSGQFDIYSIPAAGGPETRLTFNTHHDDGPDYSPDGKWIYINSNRSGKEAIWRIPPTGAGPNGSRAQMVVSDSLEDWFPHISPDGTKMVYIAYPAGTPTHDPRNVAIQLKLVAIHNDKVAATQKTLVKATGGQGSMNVNSWAPDSMRFAYVTYEPLP